MILAEAAEGLDTRTPGLIFNPCSRRQEINRLNEAKHQLPCHVQAG